MQLPTLEALTALLIPIVDREILARFNHVTSSTKADGSVVTEADLHSQQAISLALQQAFPQIPLLGEEMEAEQQQALLTGSAYLWCLDPLDGSSNFASGVPIYCTSLALLHRGEAILGLIYDPNRREWYSAIRGQGAWFNGQPLNSKPQGDELASAIAGVDLKRLSSGLAARVAREQPFRSQRNFGSGALDWAWLAQGRIQLYLHGGQKLWDYAAGELILREAGGVATTLEGEGLGCGALIPRSVVAASHRQLHTLWFQWTQAG